MRMEKCFIIFTCMLGMATSLSNVCKTPNNENGVCVDIKRCPKLPTLLKNQRQTFYILPYLMKSFCGFEGGITKLCCPLEEISAPEILMCGITKANPSKISGENKAKLGAWPWMAALGFWDTNRNDRNVQWLCGGTLISRSHVLTAAHCLTNKTYELTTVRLGELDLNPTVEDGARPIDFEVDRIIIHEEYNSEKLTSDIALVKLKESVDFNEFIQPICLPTTKTMKKSDMSGSMTILAGWGTTNTNPNNKHLRLPPSTTLKEILIPVTKMSVCKKAYSKHRVLIDDRNLCAGYPEGGKDSCKGDSGSPLMMPKGKQYFLMGIVSYGLKPCGQPGYPGVYTRVSSFIDWIVEKLNEN